MRLDNTGMPQTDYGEVSVEKDYVFLRNLTLVLLFFIITPVVIFTSLFSLISISKSSYAQNEQKVAGAKTSNLINSPESGVSVYAAIPSQNATIESDIVAADARPELIRQYLQDYNSPLAPYADLLVREADKHNMDYRLLTAIAQQESNLCKKIPPGSYNCWGWGIHSRGTLHFDSYEQAIVTVSKGIKENYINKGFDTVDEIMSKYTPLSEGSWAFGVNTFMSDIE